MRIRDRVAEPEPGLVLIADAARRLRRRGPTLGLVPAIYGAVQLCYLLACTEHLPAHWHDELRTLSHPLKWSTVVVTPLLIALVAERLAATERSVPRLWLGAATLWAVTGVAMVGALAPVAAAIAEASAKPDAARLWPGTEALASTVADARFDPGYTVTRILIWELVAVVVIAMVVAVALHGQRLVPPFTAMTVPVLVVVSLVVYSILGPAGIIMDYDPFVGDVVLGGTLAELLVPFAPMDPIGALAIGVAGLTMSALLFVTSGRAEQPPQAPMAVPVPLDSQRD